MFAQEFNYIKQFSFDNYTTNFFQKNTAGKCRYYCLLKNLNSEIAELANNIRSKTLSFFELQNVHDEPLFGNFIGVITDGGYIHPHVDPGSYIKNKFYHHVRFNFLISKPFSGGIPIVEGHKLSVEEGQGWVNFSSLHTHSCNVVVGEKPRVCLSLGVLVSQDEIQTKFKNK